MKRIFLFFMILLFRSSPFFSQPWPFTGVPADEKAVIDKINELFDNGEYEKAVKTLSYFDDKPDSQYIRQLNAFVNSRNETSPLLDKAVSLFTKGDHAESLNVVSKFLKENPGNFNGLVYLTLNLVKTDAKRAVEECDKILYWFPFNPQFIAARESAYYEMGEWNLAIKNADAFLYLNSDSAMFRNRGILYSELGKYDKALSDLSESIRLNPIGKNESYLDRAITYYLLGEAEKAEADCNTYINGGGSNVLVYKNLALIYILKGKYEKALNFSNTFLKITPESPEGYCTRAGVYNFLKEYKKAIKDSDRALKLDSKFSSAYSVRSEAYMRLGKIKEALSDANSAIEFAPNTRVKILDAYKTRGIVYLETKQKENALADLNKALEFATTDSERAEIQALIQKVKGL